MIRSKRDLVVETAPESHPFPPKKNPPLGATRSFWVIDGWLTSLQGSQKGRSRALEPKASIGWNYRWYFQLALTIDLMKTYRLMFNFYKYGNKNCFPPLFAVLANWFAFLQWHSWTWRVKEEIFQRPPSSAVALNSRIWHNLHAMVHLTSSTSQSVSQYWTLSFDLTPLIQWWV